MDDRGAWCVPSLLPVYWILTLCQGDRTGGDKAVDSHAPNSDQRMGHEVRIKSWGLYNMIHYYGGNIANGGDFRAEQEKGGEQRGGDTNSDGQGGRDNGSCEGCDIMHDSRGNKRVTNGHMSTCAEVSSARSPA